MIDLTATVTIIKCCVLYITHVAAHETLAVGLHVPNPLASVFNLFQQASSALFASKN